MKKAPKPNGKSSAKSRKDSRKKKISRNSGNSDRGIVADESRAGDKSRFNAARVP